MDAGSADELYHDAILDHRRRPRNHHVLEGAHASAQVVNPFCGDEAAVQLRFAYGRLADVGAQALGCSINRSSASMMSEAALGRSPEDIRQLAEAFEDMMGGAPPREDIAALDLGAMSTVRQYPVRIKCALLPWTALIDALESYLAERSP